MKPDQPKPAARLTTATGGPEFITANSCPKPAQPKPAEVHNHEPTRFPVMSCPACSAPAAAQSAREWLDNSNWCPYQIGDDSDPENYMMEKWRIIAALEAYKDAATKELREQLAEARRQIELLIATYESSDHAAEPCGTCTICAAEAFLAAQPRGDSK